jgi:hypothetical protein
VFPPLLVCGRPGLGGGSGDEDGGAGGDGGGSDVGGICRFR